MENGCHKPWLRARMNPTCDSVRHGSDDLKSPILSFSASSLEKDLVLEKGMTSNKTDGLIIW